MHLHLSRGKVTDAQGLACSTIGWKEIASSIDEDLKKVFMAALLKDLVCLRDDEGPRLHFLPFQDLCRLPHVVNTSSRAGANTDLIDFGTQRLRDGFCILRRGGCADLRLKV